MSNEEECKETELGLLPKEWDVVKLEQIMVPDREKIKAKEYSEKEKIVEKIPFHTGEIVFRKKKKTGTDLYLSDKNHLLTSKINFHQGAVAITNELTVATTHYDFYKILENSNILYLWYYFRSNAFKELFSQEIKFRGYKKEANYKFIKDFKIPLPSLPEQERIAYILSLVNISKEKNIDLINSLKELKKSTMKHLFTYGAVSFDDILNVELKETELGMIPKSWDEKELEYLMEFSKRPKDLKFSGSDDVIFIPMEKISDSKKLADFEIKKYKDIASGIFVIKNDLILSKITPCFENGKQAILDNLPLQYAFATTEVIPLHPKNEQIILPYFYYFLKYPKIRSYLISKMQGTTGRKRLPKEALEKLMVPKPSVPEQQQIAHILSSMDTKIEAEEKRVSALEQLFKSLLHNLMSGKVRVKDLKMGVPNA